jgi:dihydrofolate reductase
MRRLIVSTLVSLDGVIEDPGGFGEHPNGGWALSGFTEEAQRSAIEQLAASDFFLCGRITYERLYKAWSRNEGEYAGAMNAIPKLVASSTLRGPLDWNATLLDGDVVRKLAELKAQPGRDIVMYGSVTLAGALLRHGLVDEYRVAVYPVLLGQGKRLFPEGLAATRLQLVSATTLSSGVLSLAYLPEAGNQRRSA